MLALAWSLKAAFEAELQRCSLSHLELLRHTSADLVSLRKQHGTLNLRVSPVSVCVFQVGYSVMRVSLTLKPNSRSDFGIQTHWDSSGARVQLIQPGENLAFLFLVCFYLFF